MTRQADLRAESALRSIFPSPDALEDFKRDCRDRNKEKAILSILEFARRHGVIEGAEEEQLERFVATQSLLLDCVDEQDLSIEAFFKDLPVQADTRISGIRGLVGNINQFLAAEKIEIEPLDEAGTIFNHIKNKGVKTPRRREAIRCVALYLGFVKFDKPSVLRRCNYDALMAYCQASPAKERKQGNCKEGVRVLVNIYARGGLIGHDTVEELSSGMARILASKDCIVETYDITTFAVNFPLQTRPDQEKAHPFSYGRCISDAVSFAYQLMIRWMLSTNGRGRLISIGIAAGKFSKGMDLRLESIIRTKIHDDPVIRMTDFARQCVLANDLKVILWSRPFSIELPAKELLNIWGISHFFSVVYEDFCPAMLSAEILPRGVEDIQQLLVWYRKPEVVRQKKETSAILSFFQNAGNSFLGLEIAKALFFRKQYFEANEILRIILSLDSGNIVARTLRMMIFWQMGLEEPSYAVARIHFERSEEEARFVDETIPEKSEEFHCERALGLIAHACSIARRIRFGEDGPGCGEDRVADLLVAARKTLLRGITVSPTGYRSLFWLICTAVLSNLLQDDPGLFRTAELKSGYWNFDDRKRIVPRTALEIFRSAGWLRDNFTRQDLHKFIFENVIQVYDASVSLRAYRPNLKFAYALFYWDFNPEVTAGTAKQVLSWLREAKAGLENLKDNSLHIYTCIRFFAELIRPELFEQYIDDLISRINEVLQKNGIYDLNGQKDDKLIDTGGLTLCMRHFFTR